MNKMAGSLEPILKFDRYISDRISVHIGPVGAFFATVLCLANSQGNSKLMWSPHRRSKPDLVAI